MGWAPRSGEFGDVALGQGYWPCQPTVTSLPLKAGLSCLGSMGCSGIPGLLWARSLSRCFEFSARFHPRRPSVGGMAPGGGVPGSSRLSAPLGVLAQDWVRSTEAFRSNLHPQHSSWDPVCLRKRPFIISAGGSPGRKVGGGVPGTPRELLGVIRPQHRCAVSPSTVEIPIYGITSVGWAAVSAQKLCIYLIPVAIPRPRHDGFGFAGEAVVGTDLTPGSTLPSAPDALQQRKLDPSSLFLPASLSSLPGPVCPRPAPSQTPPGFIPAVSSRVCLFSFSHSGCGVK